MISKSNIPSLSEQIYHYVYLQNFAITFNWPHVGPNHYWSLAVEEHFYLFFPLLVFYLSRRNLTFSIMAIILSALAMRMLFVSNGIGVFYFTFTRMDALAIGAILALLEEKQILSKSNANKFFYGMGFIFLPLLYLWFMFGGDANNVIQIVKPLLIALLYFCLIGYIASSHNFYTKILNTPILSYTGKISYGLYMYHPLCFYLYQIHFKTNYLFLDILASFGIAYCLASISFNIFENKILKLKERFTYGQKIKVNKEVAV